MHVPHGGGDRACAWKREPTLDFTARRWAAAAMDVYGAVVSKAARLTRVLFSRSERYVPGRARSISCWRATY
jgi:hypothetical protein